MLKVLPQYTGVKGQGSHLTRGINQAPLKLPLGLPKPLASLHEALLGMSKAS